MNRAASALLATAAALLMFSGCGSNKRSYAENARLRSEIVELNDRIRSLELANAELWANFERSATQPKTVPDEVLASTPQLTRIDIGRLSHMRDADGDKAIDHIIIYVHPVDARERFVQIVGNLVANATFIPTDAEPQNIGRVTLSPAEVREAYRSSLTGTHYSIELPVEPLAGNHRAADRVLITVSFTDGYTGRQLTADRTIEISPREN